MELMTNLLVVEVTFHRDRLEEGNMFTFSGDIEEGNEIYVPPGLGLIVLNLRTEPAPEPPSEGAKYQTAPIQWFQKGAGNTLTNNPALPPGMFMSQRIGDNTVTLLDFNTAQASEVEPGFLGVYHWFNIVVTYEGRTYGADPTIINLPPGSGPPPEEEGLPTRGNRNPAAKGRTRAR